MLLTPQNKGEYGTLNLNNIIQSRINKIDEEFDDYVTTTINGVKVRFKRGDIVINCKNNYGMKVSTGDETNVMNGQIGKVVKVGVDIDGNKIMVIDFDGEDVRFTEDTFYSLKLGNAITAHKSQGSEAKVVINLTIPQHKHMLSKELTYTSRTRAKCKLIEIGSPEIIDWAQSVNANDVAQTRLCEFLLDTNG
jgi:exodeoxyribonuclease V alpha subunit